MKLLLTILAITVISTVNSVTASDDVRLTADDDYRWCKGNMHTHSLWSDGDDYPEMIAKWYLEHEYQFLVFTDHNTLLNKERWINSVDNKGGDTALRKLQAAGLPKSWIEMRDVKGDAPEIRLKTFDEVFELLAIPQNFLLIQGEEVSDRFGRLPVHMCVTNTSTLLTPLGGDSVAQVMQRNVDAALSHRARTGEAALIHLNHPNFNYAVTAEQLMQIVGEKFFEVYNGHPAVENVGDEQHASTDRMWDIINTWRLSRLDLPVMYGLATDDCHSYHTSTSIKDSQPGRGWVMVLSESLTPEALVQSLEAGQFYSSSGVTLKSVTKEDNEFTIVIDAEPDVTYTTDFIGTRHGFDDTSTPASDDPKDADKMTRKYSDEVGSVLKSVTGSTATYEFSGDEIYVRALVTSSRTHPNPGEPGEMEQAWVQPVQP
ncbi:MAG: hypothetical protein MK102_12020 [Fuerstiella sp.]|nr:hypothetical protein [Fuerstiella sp.]